MTHDDHVLDARGPIHQSIPVQYAPFMNEPAFSISQSTMLGFWYNNEWTLYGCLNDDIQTMLAILDGDPQTYIQWAEAYYEIDVNCHAVESLYHNTTLNDTLITSLNHEMDMTLLWKDLLEIGYP